MKRIALASVVLALAALGCGDDKARSLLPIDIVPAADVTGVANVHVVVTHGQGMTDQHVTWDRPAGETLKVAIYLPSSVEGAVSVSATAADASGAVVGVTGSQMATVSPGQVAAVVTLQLRRAEPGMGDAGMPADAAAGETGAPADAALVPDGGATEAGADAAPGDSAAPADTAPDLPVSLTWKPGEPLENDIVSRSFSPTVGIDGQGNALVAWSERSALKTRRYDVATKAWGDPKTVENKGSVGWVRLRMAANGYAVVVWGQAVGDVPMGDEGVWASSSRDGGNTWSPPKQVHRGPQYAEIVLAISRTGDARIAWEESMANMRTLWSARFDEGTGTWNDVAAVRPGEDTDYRYPKIAMDARGNGLLAWLQDDAQGEQSIWASSFQVGKALDAPALMDTHTGRADDPAVALMPDGSRGILVWGQSHPSGGDVMYRDWTPAGGFGSPTLMTTNPDWTGAHAVVMDHAATTTVTWSQPIASGKANVVVIRRLANQPWGAVEPLETSNQAAQRTDEYGYPAMGIDAIGNVHVTWARRMSATDPVTYSAVTRRYSGGLWQPEVTVGMKTGLRANDPEVAVSESGRAAISFYYYHPMGTQDPTAYTTFAALFQ
jgi:hypothetical protein